jgi:hypothetical protein
MTRHDGDLQLVEKVASSIRATAEISGVSVCVTRPTAPDRGRKPALADIRLARILDDLFAAHPRVTFSNAGEWTVRFVQGTCASSTPGDEGTTDAVP